MAECRWLADKRQAADKVVTRLIVLPFFGLIVKVNRHDPALSDTKRPLLTLQVFFELDATVKLARAPLGTVTERYVAT